MLGTRYLIAQYSRPAFYVIKFLSFVIVIKFLEQIQNFIAQYIPGTIPEMGITLVTWVGAYIIADVLLPDLLSWIYKSTVLED